MIDVCVGAHGHPTQVVGIVPEIGLHIFVNFFLEVDADGSIDAYDFVGADAGVGGDIASRIGNMDVSGIVADGVSGAFLGGSNEALKECLLGGEGSDVRLGKDRGGRERQDAGSEKHLRAGHDRSLAKNYEGQRKGHKRKECRRNGGPRVVRTRIFTEDTEEDATERKGITRRPRERGCCDLIIRYPSRFGPLKPRASIEASAPWKTQIRTLTNQGCGPPAKNAHANPREQPPLEG